jgi:hypothetical protein
LAGVIVSVHRAAFYVRRTVDDRLVVVASESVGGLPGGILVRGRSDLRAIGLEPAMRLGPTVDGWAVPAAALRIEGGSALPWSPALPAAARRGVTAWGPRRIADARTLAAGLARLGSLASGRGATDDPWSATIVTTLRRLVMDLIDDAEGAAARDAVALIGVGPGLTPAGDDVLVGLLAGLDAIGHPLRAKIGAALAATAPSRTTSVGAATIDHAVRGAYAEWLHDVLVTLGAVSGAVDPLRPAIARAMSVGATSGGDTLVGVFAAMDVADARAERAARVVRGARAAA